MKLAVGDRVKVIKRPTDCSNCHNCFVGHIGVINQIPYGYSSDKIYVYPFEDKDMGCSGFKAEHLELVSEVTQYDMLKRQGLVK